MAATHSLRHQPNQLYQYSRLNASEPTIRLLEVLPSLTKGELSLAIKHIPLAQAKKQYHTISYTWGHDDPSHRVYIGSQYLLLRDSIWSFLKHHHEARSLVAPRWLWIDSICINQSDIAEKNQQVSIMGQIFRESYGTLIWLDTLSMQGSFTMSFQSYWSKIPRNTDYDERSRLLDIFLYGSEELKVRENRKSIRQDVIDLFKHNYWRRLWVVQEIILSRRIMIVTGRTTINLELILESFYTTTPYNNSNISGLFGDEYLDYSLQRLLTNRMGKINDRQSLSLLHLLQEFGKHGCKDIRDRVYGLRALTGMADQVVVDYNCHVVTLFAATLRSYVLDSQDFGPRRENTHMDDVKSMMRALNVD